MSTNTLFDDVDLCQPYSLGCPKPSTMDLDVVNTNSTNLGEFEELLAAPLSFEGDSLNDEAWLDNNLCLTNTGGNHHLHLMPEVGSSSNTLAMVKNSSIAGINRPQKLRPLLPRLESVQVLGLKSAVAANQQCLEEDYTESQPSSKKIKIDNPAYGLFRLKSSAPDGGIVTTKIKRGPKIPRACLRCKYDKKRVRENEGCMNAS